MGDLGSFSSQNMLNGALTGIQGVPQAFSTLPGSIQQFPYWIGSSGLSDMPIFGNLYNRFRPNGVKNINNHNNNNNIHNNNEEDEKKVKEI